MFGFGRKNRCRRGSTETLVETVEPIEDKAIVPVEIDNPPVQEIPKKIGLFTRLKQGLSRTRAGLTKGLANLFLGRKTIDAELLEDIETLLRLLI
ncbi:MAG: hypothetical protein R3E08_11195 [Thiotrichaceae bacterium]